jgi:hypothetical protein
VEVVVVGLETVCCYECNGLVHRDESEMRVKDFEEELGTGSWTIKQEEWGRCESRWICHDCD